MDDTERDDARQAAIRRLKAKGDLRTHLVAFVVVNAVLVMVWAVTGRGYFWPIWPIAGWAIGLVLHGWTVYYERPITEADIQREMSRRQR